MTEFDDKLADHDEARDHLVDVLTDRGLTVTVWPFDESDRYRPDLSVTLGPGTTTHSGVIWLDVKLWHTIQEKELAAQLAMKERRILYVLGCADLDSGPCAVTCAPILMDDRFTERVPLRRSKDFGRKVPHGLGLCRSLAIEFP